MSEKPKCFIVMPISTPAELAEKQYGGDADHFKHVLESLFCPAVEAADCVPVKPIAQGDEMIHGRIIQHLEQDDLVLCDMTSLNANVFFELGVRTPLNKKAILVRDERTKKIPFDLTGMNCLTYKSTLHGWEIENERQNITAHIRESVREGATENTLWKVFGMSRSASPHSEPSESDRIEFLSKQVASLRSDIRNLASSAGILSKGQGYINTFSGERISDNLPPGLVIRRDERAIEYIDNNSVPNRFTRRFVENEMRVSGSFESALDAISFELNLDWDHTLELLSMMGFQRVGPIPPSHSTPSSGDSPTPSD